MTLQPGQSISREDCKLLEDGDWLFDGHQAVRYASDMFDPADGAYVLHHASFTFLGRPIDGWIPWSGGENPLPGHEVEVRLREGSWSRDQSDFFAWFHSPKGARDTRSRAVDIIGWRPAPSVEGLGALRPEDRASVPTEREDGPSDHWLPMDTAPLGCITENVGCRGDSEWFLGRPAEQYRRQAPPFVVIKRRGWPNEDSWACHGGAYYVPSYFDAWKPLAALSASGPAGGGGEWKAAAKGLSHALADERDHTILLAGLLRKAREYVSDSLDAHEHSDGRELLTAIDAALSAPGSEKGAGE